MLTFPTCGRYWKTYIEQEVKYLYKSQWDQVRTDFRNSEQPESDNLVTLLLFSLFLQIRARNYERVEKVNKRYKKITAWLFQ